MKLSRWRHWLNFIKTNGAAPRAAKSTLQRSRLCRQLHRLWKSFELHKSSKLGLRWTCTCCHDWAGFNCYLLPLSHFSLFFVSLGALHNSERSLNSREVQHQPREHQATSWWHDDVLLVVRCSHTQQQPFRTLRSLKNEPQQRENERKGKQERECVRYFPGWLLPTLHGFFLAPEFNDSMSDHDEPMS